MVVVSQKAIFAVWICISVVLADARRSRRRRSSDVASSSFAVIGYLPEWRQRGANYEIISTVVTHLIMFSLEISPEGDIEALDRIPDRDVLDNARSSTRQEGTELLIGFGGNGRSAGFRPMVRNDDARKRFVQAVVELCNEFDFDGVDYNWEYPGYSFQKGYLPTEEVRKDYEGLALLLKETHKAFDIDAKRMNREGGAKIVSLAYYPDSRQEQILASIDATKYASYLHAMSYDQGGPSHSSFALATKSVKQYAAVFTSVSSMTLGVPFYGRSPGEWKSYEDIVRADPSLDADVDTTTSGVNFNGVNTIRRKVKMSVAKGLGGVMIWEVGQDCRLAPVRRSPSEVHERTCPDDSKSLLYAIRDAMRDAGAVRYRAMWWRQRRGREKMEQAGVRTSGISAGEL